jgi:hypothetical protein
MFGWESIINAAASKAVDLAISHFVSDVRAIEHKLDLLIFKDFNTALDYLEEAERFSKDPARSTAAVGEGYRYFRQSFGIKDSWVQAISSFGMCLCCLLLDEKREFIERSKQCYFACSRTMDELAQDAFRGATSWGTSIPPVFEFQFGTAAYNEFRDRARKQLENASWLRKAEWYMTLFFNSQFAGPPTADLLVNDERYVTFRNRYLACRDMQTALLTPQMKMDALLKTGSQ